MANLIENFSGDTPPIWRKIRNTSIIVGMVLAWFVAAPEVYSIVYPDWLDTLLKMSNGFTGLLILISQGQGIKAE